MSDILQVIQYKPIVMYDSPEAASLKTVTGWVSSSGHYWGDNEHMARYDGSTHTKCEECGETRENNRWCEPCHNRKDLEKFIAMKREPWDGDSPIYSDLLDRYFFHESIFDFLNDSHNAGILKPYTAEELRLIHCEPTYLHKIDADDWSDDLPDDNDGELPDDVQAAVDALNAVIAKAGPVSWTPGNTAVQLPLTDSKS